MGERHDVQLKRDLKICALASQVHCSKFESYVPFEAKWRKHTWINLTRGKHPISSMSNGSQTLNCVDYILVLKTWSQSRQVHDPQSSRATFTRTDTFIDHQIARTNKSSQIEQNSLRATLGFRQPRYENKHPRSTSEGVYLRQVLAANFAGWGYLPLNNSVNAKILAIIKKHGSSTSSTVCQTLAASSSSHVCFCLKI